MLFGTGPRAGSFFGRDGSDGLGLGEVITLAGHPSLGAVSVLGDGDEVGIILLEIRA